MLGKTDSQTASIAEMDQMQKQLNDITRYLDMLKKQRMAIDKQIENFTKMQHDLNHDIMNMGK